MSSSIEVLSKVRVNVGSNDPSGDCLRKYNGKVFNVVDIKKHRLGDEYYLDGAKSKKGIPYVFVETWLEPVD